MRNFIIYYGDEINVTGTLYAACMETLSRVKVTLVGALVWRLDLLTTLTHDS
jgi:hypothetical protein